MKSLGTTELSRESVNWDNSNNVVEVTANRNKNVKMDSKTW